MKKQDVRFDDEKCRCGEHFWFVPLLGNKHVKVCRVCLTLKSNCRKKKLKMLKGAVQIWIMFYAFCNVHPVIRERLQEVCYSEIKV